MDKLLTEVAMKVGGVLAVVGLFVGALLWYPQCDALGFAKECHNFWGPVSLNVADQPSTLGLVATGSAVGAVVGAVLGFLVGAIWPSTKKDLGLD